VPDPADSATVLVVVATTTASVAILTTEHAWKGQVSDERGELMGETAKEHETGIIVNGQEKTVTEKQISFDGVVALAFNPVPEGPYILITVAYRRGHGEKPQGTLTKGESVKVKNGMIFDVTATDRS
jgi:hypothetical protein